MRLVLGILIAIILLVLILRDRLVLKPQADEHRPDLERAWHSVHHPSSSALIDEHNLGKTGRVLVGGSFKSSMSYLELRAHYDVALAELGWRFRSERGLRDWGRDLGGHEATYCNGSESATLEVTGERAGYGWTYSLDFGWGQHVCP